MDVGGGGGGGGGGKSIIISKEIDKLQPQPHQLMIGITPLLVTCSDEMLINMDSKRARSKEDWFFLFFILRATLTCQLTSCTCRYS